MGGFIIIRIKLNTYWFQQKTGEEKRCVHFYACVCAFASDEKLQEEFSFFTNLDMSMAPATTTSKFTQWENKALLKIGRKGFEIFWRSLCMLKVTIYIYAS